MIKGSVRNYWGMGGGSADFCPHKKHKKFDSTQTFGKKTVTLPNHPKNCDPPQEVQWPSLLKHNETFGDVNNSSGELPVTQLGLHIVLAFSFRNQW